MKRLLRTFCVLFFLSPVILNAGIEWQTQIITKTKDKESKTIIKGYAQKGMMREEYTEVTDDKNQLTKKGMYWLYYPQNNDVYIVDPEEKVYFVINIDSLSKFTSAMGKFIKLTISNPKVEMQKLENEDILGINCMHLKINTAYDMETKIMIMKVKSHIEESKELWCTAKHIDEISSNFYKKTLSTGIATLDSLISKEAEVYGNMGFVLKSITTSKTSDARGKVNSESTTEYTVQELLVRDLDENLFKIPSDYKQVEFKINLENEE